MALVVITRERTVRLRKAYLVDMDGKDMALLKAAQDTGQPDEFIDEILEPYYTSAVTTSADEIIEMTTQDRDLAVSLEQVHPVSNDKEDK